METIGIVFVHVDAKKPTKAFDSDACYDLYSPSDVVIPRGRVVVVPLGFKIQLSPGMEMTIRPRSGLSTKGLVAILGTIDAGYRGEVGAIMHYIGPEEHFKIKAGDRIAQASFDSIHNVQFEDKLILTESDRGANGFGSTN